MISKNKIKYIRSLRNKKYRNEYRQFFAEGDKIVGDILISKPGLVRELIATPEWLSLNKNKLSPVSSSIITEAGSREYEQISSLETPPGVMALFDIEENVAVQLQADNKLIIALESIQDPGNMGTIIRTASWFGISSILCSEDSADCYNPKVVQASMGGIFSVKISYCGLAEELSKAATIDGLTVYGTFIEGKRIWNEKLNNSAVIVFGNESRGISGNLLPYIREKLTIPGRRNEMSQFTDSLNVASAVAIICSAFTRY